MKPMELKEPTKCCGSPTLMWIKGKCYFMCPCGETKLNVYGRPRRPQTVVGKGRRTKL